MMSFIKKCYKCKIEKSSEEFSKRRSGKDGLQGECKLCSEKYRAENKEKITKQAMQRYYSDTNFRLVNVLRARVRIAIKKGCKSAQTMELLGCSIEEVKSHLESQFTEGMTWDNHGEWHIDHIIPCASFDLTDPEQQKKCFHYTNLQPLWASENISKGARLEYQAK